VLLLPNQAGREFHAGRVVCDTSARLDVTATGKRYRGVSERIPSDVPILVLGTLRAIMLLLFSLYGDKSERPSRAKS
jgi:hypothetical protein